MNAYRQIHIYPLDIGWLSIEVMVVGVVGRATKGEPYEYRYWLRREQGE